MIVIWGTSFLMKEPILTPPGNSLAGLYGNATGSSVFQVNAAQNKR